MKNPWKHKEAEIAKLKAEIKKQQLAQSAKAFAERFTEMLGTIAAHTARKDWPRAFHIAFEHAAKDMPNAAQAWLSQKDG